MKFFRRLFNLFRRKNQKVLTPEQVVDDDPVMRDIVARVWNTGKAEYGTISKDGKVTSCQFNPKTGKPLTC